MFLLTDSNLFCIIKIRKKRFYLQTFWSRLKTLKAHRVLFSRGTQRVHTWGSKPKLHLPQVFMWIIFLLQKSNMKLNYVPEIDKLIGRKSMKNSSKTVFPELCFIQFWIREKHCSKMASAIRNILFQKLSIYIKTFWWLADFQLLPLEI